MRESIARLRAAEALYAIARSFAALSERAGGTKGALASGSTNVPTNVAASSALDFLEPGSTSPGISLAKDTKGTSLFRVAFAAANALLAFSLASRQGTRVCECQ